MKLKPLATTSAATFLLMAAACTAPAATPADPWHVGTSKDEMSDQRTSSAKATIVSDGHSYDLTVTCSQFAGVSGIGLEVLAPNDRFQILENTTLHGSDLMGYNADTTSRVAVRLRFDAGEVFIATANVTYNNAFALAFFDKAKVKAEMDKPPVRDGNPMVELTRGLLTLGAAFGGTADVSQLIAAAELKIQPTLAHGETPVLRVPLTATFKRFVAQCVYPETAAALERQGGFVAHPDAIGALNGSTFRYIRSPGNNLDVIFRDGRVSIMFGNQTQVAPHPYTIEGNRITLDEKEGVVGTILGGDAMLVTGPGFSLTLKKMNGTIP